jgi:hypothetical protein
MEVNFTKIEAAVSFVCSAIIAALSIGYVASEELRLPPLLIRLFALLSAVLIGGVLIIRNGCDKED